MSIDTPLSDVIIEGNTFDYGNFAVNGNLATVPTNYGYVNCILTNADATISHNLLSGALTTSTHILTQFDSLGSCVITNNNFIRGTTPIVAYIDVSEASSDQVITDNIFDQPTVDGISETLVLLPTANVFSATGPFILYERNKNQTAIKQIQKSPYQVSFTSTPGINRSDRADYTLSLISNYFPATGFYSTVGSLTTFQEGVALNYTTPFSNVMGIQLPGTFTVTNGSASVSCASKTTVAAASVNGDFDGYIIFGNDNAYYPVVMDVTVVGSVALIYGMTLGTPYTGTTNVSASAIFFPSFQTNLLNFPLVGTYAVNTASPNVTGPTANLIQGSQITFNDTTGAIYQVLTITSINSFVLATDYGGPSNFSGTATTGLATVNASFSINLSEILPENVQIISTIFGAYPSTGTDSLVSASYSAVISTDSGNTYSSPTLPEVLPGTFTLTSGSASVATSVAQGGIGPGSSLNFASQPWFTYSVSSVSPTTITLTTPYTTPPTYPSPVTTTATCFDNSLADVVNYNPLTTYTNVYLGSPPAMTIPNGTTVTQYLKVDPAFFGFSAYTSSSRLIRYNLSIGITMATPGILFMSESPLIVKYRW
jgi:hypothetical protein